MEEMIDRRRFVALAGAAGIVTATGCIGGGEETPGESEPNEGSEQTSENESSEEDGQTSEDEQSTSFEFPPGANESGIVTETVVAGTRQFVDDQHRYRATHTYELDYADAPTDDVELTYDIDDRLVHEQQLEQGVETDRWATPENVVARTVNADAERTDQWTTERVGSMAPPGGAFNRYPFEETTAPSLLQSASFDFEGIVTEIDGEGENEDEDEDENDSKPSYARYSGDISNPSQLELAQPKTARMQYELQSVSDGTVSVLLAETGAIHALEYEFSAEATRLTHDGRESVELETRGEIEFEYDDELEAVTKPEWGDAPDPDQFRRFDLAETSLGQTYKLVGGPSLPGSVELEYAEFYLTAQFGDDVYLDRYTPRMGFGPRDGVVAWLDEENELHFEWASLSGRDALLEADRVEMSIYLYSPANGRSLIYHEAYRP